MNDRLDISISEAGTIKRLKDKHCLDKKRVKEAIEKELSKTNNLKSDIEEVMNTKYSMFLLKLREELGL